MCVYRHLWADNHPVFLSKYVLTRGGAVISASSTMIVNGKPVALVGDKVSCPIPGHGTNAIIEGAPEWSSDGKAIVVDGCKCQCGCQVISGAPECAIG